MKIFTLSFIIISIYLLSLLLVRVLPCCVCYYLIHIQYQQLDSLVVVSSSSTHSFACMYHTTIVELTIVHEFVLHVQTKTTMFDKTAAKGTCDTFQERNWTEWTCLVNTFCTETLSHTGMSWKTNLENFMN